MNKPIILIYQGFGGEFVISGSPKEGGNALCKANDVTTHGQFPVKTEPGVERNSVNVVAVSVKVNGIPFIGYFAKVEIKKGDELFISYGKSYWQNLKENKEKEHKECHITKIIPAGFEEIFNSDTDETILREKSSSDGEPAAKRRRVDESCLKVGNDSAKKIVWIDLTAEDDLLGESSTDVCEDDIRFFEGFKKPLSSF